MTEFDDGFSSRPKTQSDAPDACQYTGCDIPPDMAVKFRRPQEYLCYCNSHVTDVYNLSHAKAQYRIR